MAAFALGLIGDRSARDPLVAALGDRSPLVKGSAAEALGAIGDAAAADADRRDWWRSAQSEALAQVPTDDLDAARDTRRPHSGSRCTRSSRLKAYDALASALLDGRGSRGCGGGRWHTRSSGSRIHVRCGRCLRSFARRSRTRAHSPRKGLGAMKDAGRATAALTPLVAAPIAPGCRSGSIARSPRRPRRGAAAPEDRPDAEGTPAVAARSGQRARDDPRGWRPTIALLDVLGDPSAGIRAAAIGALAAFDPEGLHDRAVRPRPDPHWTVRAALATLLGTLAPEAGAAAAASHAADQDAASAAVRCLPRSRSCRRLHAARSSSNASSPTTRSSAPPRQTRLAELKPPARPGRSDRGLPAGAPGRTY